MAIPTAKMPAKRKMPSEWSVPTTVEGGPSYAPPIAKAYSQSAPCAPSTKVLVAPPSAKAAAWPPAASSVATRPQFDSWDETISELNGVPEASDPGVSPIAAIEAGGSALQRAVRLSGLMWGTTDISESLQALLENFGDLARPPRISTVADGSLSVVAVFSHKEAACAAVRSLSAADGSALAEMIGRPEVVREGLSGRYRVELLADMEAPRVSPGAQQWTSDGTDGSWGDSGETRVSPQMQAKDKMSSEGLHTPLVPKVALRTTSAPSTASSTSYARGRMNVTAKTARTDESAWDEDSWLAQAQPAAGLSSSGDSAVSAEVAEHDWEAAWDASEALQEDEWLQAANTTSEREADTGVSKEAEWPAASEEDRWEDETAAGGTLAPADASSRVVRVVALPPGWAQDDVEELCHAYGEVQATQRALAGGIDIMYSTHKQAEAASLALNGLEVEGNSGPYYLRCILQETERSTPAPSAVTKSELRQKPKNIGSTSHRDAPKPTAAIAIHIDELMQLQSGDASPHACEVFLQNLPVNDYTETELQAWLGAFGKVQDAVFLKNTAGAGSELSGSGYAAFASHGEAVALLAAIPQGDAGDSVLGFWSFSERLLCDDASGPELRRVVRLSLSHMLPKLKAQAYCSSVVLAGDSSDGGRMRFELSLAPAPNGSVAHALGPARALLTDVLAMGDGAEANDADAALANPASASKGRVASGQAVKGRGRKGEVSGSNSQDCCADEMSKDYGKAGGASKANKGGKAGKGFSSKGGAKKGGDKDMPVAPEPEGQSQEQASAAANDPDDEGMVRPCVFVQGFPDSWQRHELEEVFKAYGAVRAVHFIDDPLGRAARVEFTDPRRLAVAAERVNNKEIDGSMLQAECFGCDVVQAQPCGPYLRALFLDELTMPKRPDVLPSEQDRQVFVQNIGDGMCWEEDLKPWMEASFGQIDDILVLTDESTGRPRGKAYVRFRDHKAAICCCEQDACSKLGKGAYASWSESERAAQRNASVYKGDLNRAFMNPSGVILPSVLVRAKVPELRVESPLPGASTPGKPMQFLVECSDDGLAEVAAALANVLEFFHTRIQEKLRTAEAKCASEAQQSRFPVSKPSGLPKPREPPKLSGQPKPSGAPNQLGAHSSLQEAALHRMDSALGLIAEQATRGNGIGPSEVARSSVEKRIRPLPVKAAPSSAPVELQVQARIRRGETMVREAQVLYKAGQLQPATVKYRAGLRLLMDEMPTNDDTSSESVAYRARIDMYLREAETLRAELSESGLADFPAPSATPQPALPKSTLARGPRPNGAVKPVPGPQPRPASARPGEDSVLKARLEECEAVMREAQTLEDKGRMEEACDKYCTGLQRLAQGMQRLSVGHLDEQSLRSKVARLIGGTTLLQDRLRKAGIDVAELFKSTRNIGDVIGRGREPHRGRSRSPRPLPPVSKASLASKGTRPSPRPIGSMVSAPPGAGVSGGPRLYPRPTPSATFEQGAVPRPRVPLAPGLRPSSTNRPASGL